MALTHKSIFLKAWLWSLIGSIVLVAIVWLVTGFAHFLQGNLVRLVDVMLAVSLIGDVLGASLIAWRVAEKYYPSRMSVAIKRYFWFSLLSLVIAVLILFTPFSWLVGLWSLASALCVTLALPDSKIGSLKAKRSST